MASPSHSSSSLFAAAVGVHRAGARQRRRRPDALGDREDRRLRDASRTPRGTPEPSRTSIACSAWLDTHGLERIQIQKQATDWVDNLGAGEISGYTQDAISFAQGAAFSIVVTLFNLVLIVVIAIYMLLDMERLEGAIDRRFPPGDGLPLTLRIEKALAGYVRGQLILSTVIGLSAGVGMWLLGTTGLVPGAERYALLFGVWTARDRGDSVHRALALGDPAARSTPSSSIRCRRSGSSRSSSSSTRSRVTSSCRT